MYGDYVACVRAEYERKKANGAFPYDLMNPTPAAVRDACIRVCRDRYERRDAGFMETFFKVKGDQADVCHAIGQFDIDRFKPLIRYLRKEVGEPGVKNVELLAWLIDYQGRPFQPEKKYVLPEPEMVEVPEAGGESTLPGEGQEPSGKEHDPIKKTGKGKLLAGGIMTAVLGLCVYAFYPDAAASVEKETPPIMPKFGQSCMYWSGERFIKISCLEKNAGDTIQIVGFDSTVFVGLKRITNLDTITLKSIGYVWYLKRDKKLEFFTAGGFHPIHRSKLHPITAYIIRKYLPGNL